MTRERNSRMVWPGLMRTIGSLTCLIASGASAWADGCYALNGGSAVGRRYTDTLAEATRLAVGAATVRKLELGRAYTMEFRGDRLNLVIDKAEIVVAVRCG